MKLPPSDAWTMVVAAPDFPKFFRAPESGANTMNVIVALSAAFVFSNEYSYHQNQNINIHLTLEYQEPFRSIPGARLMIPVMSRSTYVYIDNVKYGNVRFDETTILSIPRYSETLEIWRNDIVTGRRGNRASNTLIISNPNDRNIRVHCRLSWIDPDNLYCIRD
jgi:hypothetical protein